MSVGHFNERYRLISKKNRCLWVWSLSVSFLCILVSGCASKYQVPPYPSDWPAEVHQACDCSAFSGTYTNNGIEAQADGRRTAASLADLLDLEESDNIQQVTLRLGAIGDHNEGELVITGMRDGIAVTTQTLAYKCVNDEVVFDEWAHAGAFYLFVMYFESSKKSLTIAGDGALIVKSFWSDRALVLLFPVRARRFSRSGAQ